MRYVVGMALTLGEALDLPEGSVWTVTPDGIETWHVEKQRLLWVRKPSRYNTDSRGADPRNLNQDCNGRLVKLGLSRSPDPRALSRGSRALQDWLAAVVSNSSAPEEQKENK